MKKPNKNKEDKMEKPNERGSIFMQGHVLIRDTETKQVLVDKKNAIHNENMSVALAKSLGNDMEGPIYSMFFGNGGSTVNGIGVITYLPPQVTGPGASLYNPTYSEVVDQSRSGPADNNMSVNHVINTEFSDLVVTCTLGFGEPAGQSSFDDATDLNQEFVFDELGLYAFGAPVETGPLLTHVIFSPVQKSLNRSIEIIYTIRIQMC